MQLTKFFFLGLLGFAVAQKGKSAGGAKANTVAIITEGMNSVQTALEALDASIMAIDPSKDIEAQAKDLENKSKAVTAKLQTASKALASAPKANILEAAGILTPSQKLQTSTQKTVADLIAKKDIIVKANKAPIVQAQLAEQSAAVEGFKTAILSKMPDIAQGIAGPMADGIANEIKKAVQAFT